MPQYNESMIGTISGTPTGLIINPLHQKLYAKAIYDNIAESTDELAFKRGDILAIIEQDTDGLEGWWLCSLRGRQGICPGNRLKLIHNSYDSGCYSPSPISSPSPSIISTPTSSIYHSSNSFTQSDLYENSGFIQQQLQQQKHGKRRSWHIMTNKVITPQKCGDVYLYDLLPQSNRTSPYQNLSTMSDPDAYDIPKPAVHINYDTASSSSHRSSITSQSRSSGGGGGGGGADSQHQQQHQQQQQQQQRLISTPTIPDDSYDIPRPSTLLSQQNLTPSSSNSSLLTSDSLSLSSSNRSSLINMPDYDIPKRNPKAIIDNINNRCTTPSQQTNAVTTVQTPNSNSMMMTYDIPQQQQQQQQQQQKQYLQQKQLGKKELPLKLSSALESLAKLQDEATSAVTRLLAFVTPSWREKDKLDPILMDVKLAAVRLRTALHDLAEFGEGALGNAGRADDKSLALKLRPLVKALRDADKLIHEASLNLDHYGWTVEVLARSEQPHKLQSIQNLPPDCLDQLIACAQTLTEDVRQIASFIQGNATLLFNRTITTSSSSSSSSSSPSSTTTTPTSALAKCSINDDSTEDYEYVHLKLHRNGNNNIVNQLRQSNAADVLAAAENLQTNKLKSSLQENINENTNNNNNLTLTPHDKSLLIYYTTQTVTHMGYLTQAIDAFLQTVERNQPPKFFLAYGKFVVLSAHNIVYIGDIVSRNVSCKNIQMRLMHCADMLSDALKTCVAKTKNAAQLFPSVTAVQEMVDSVVDISHLAYELKVALLQTNIIR